MQQLLNLGATGNSEICTKMKYVERNTGLLEVTGTLSAPRLMPFWEAAFSSRGTTRSVALHQTPLFASMALSCFKRSCTSHAA